VIGKFSGPSALIPRVLLPMTRADPRLDRHQPVADSQLAAEIEESTPPF